MKSSTQIIIDSLPKHPRKIIEIITNNREVYIERLQAIDAIVKADLKRAKKNLKRLS